MASDDLLSFKSRLCLLGLGRLTSQLRKPDCRFLDQIPLLGVEDDAHRFRLWGGNIGAFQDPEKRSSLDARLKDAPQVRRQISRLLDRLSAASDQALAICTGTRVNRVEDDSDAEHQTLEDSSCGRLRTEVSEIKELSLTISGTVSRLFKLSMAIRKPAQYDRYKKLAQIEPLSSFYDIMHVKEKFPRLQGRQYLADRLGKANAQRRDYFRYRRDHKEKLSKAPIELQLKYQKLSAEVDEPKREHDAVSHQQPQSSMGSTKASTFVPPPGMMELPEYEERSDAGQSETSFATSVGEEDSNALRVPPPPIASEAGLAFECPYCFTIQQPRNRRAWKKHVFEDMQPYICTFELCTTKPFSSRSAWFDHELQYHRKEWICNMCNHPSFVSSGAFKDHIHSRHEKEVTKPQIPTIMDICMETLSEIHPEDCLLCDHWALNIKTKEQEANPQVDLAKIVVTPVQFRNHLARHLEQIALFTLPRNDEGEGGSEANSKNAVFDADSEADLNSDQISHSEQSDNEDYKEGFELYTAVVNENFDRVYELLNTGVDANVQGPSGEYAVGEAASLGLHRVVELLLEHGADPNVPAGLNGSAVVAAQLAGYHDVAQLLLQYGAEEPGQTKERQEEPNSQMSHAQKETAFRVIHSWRQYIFRRHREQINESGLSSPRIAVREVAAAIIQGSWRRYKSLRGPFSEGITWPLKPTTVDLIWGRLFDRNNKPTARLDSFLRGIAQYLIEEFEPRMSIVIGPGKMQRFYTEFGEEDEICDWSIAFDDEKSSISRFYRSMEMSHHLVQDDNILEERPDIPALTPHGFSKWMTILLLAQPHTEIRRLGRICYHLPICNPDDRKERFPKEISSRLFPSRPDSDSIEMLRLGLETHCRGETRFSTENTDDFTYSTPLSPRNRALDFPDQYLPNRPNVLTDYNLHKLEDAKSDPLQDSTSPVSDYPEISPELIAQITQNVIDQLRTIEPERFNSVLQPPSYSESEKLRAELPAPRTHSDTIQRPGERPDTPILREQEMAEERETNTARAVNYYGTSGRGHQQ